MGDQTVTETGIPTMNAENKLSNRSLLFGLIAESAQSNRLFVILNRTIKANSADAMIIPMNIRPDDLYFTVSNMKKSHVNGSYIAQEYQENVMDLLETQDELVHLSGACDFVLREGETLGGSFLLPQAVKQFVEEQSIKKIAIIGAGALARGLALTLDAFELHFYDPEIERIMKSSEQIGKELDINRIDDDLPTDLSTYDLVINTLDDKVFAQTRFASLVLDLGVDEAYKIVTKRCVTEDANAEYLDFNVLLEPLSQLIYTNYIKD